MNKQMTKIKQTQGTENSATASLRLFIFPMLCVDGVIRIWVLPYAMDVRDNRLTDSRDANPNTWAYDNRDRLKKRGKLNYAYDLNGSLISITHQDTGLQKSFIYNLDNRLTEVKDGSGNTIARYQYDPFGRRVSKTVNGTPTYYFYAQEGLVAEVDGTGTVKTQYGYRPSSQGKGAWGTNPLFIKQAGYVGCYQNDQLGTPQQVVTASGQVIWDAHYSAFGKATVTTELIKNNLRLAGQYFDAETGLHYNYFRYYDPSTGRYVTSDPIGLAGGINAYGYVGGNPANRADPLGLFISPLTAPFLYRLVFDPASLPSLPQEVVNFAAGFGDAASFNLTRATRDAFGIDGGVDVCSSAYKFGRDVNVLVGPTGKLNSLRSIRNSRKYLADIRAWRNNSKMPIGTRWKSIKIAKEYHKNTLIKELAVDPFKGAIKEGVINTILGY